MNERVSQEAASPTPRRSDEHGADSRPETPKVRSLVSPLDLDSGGLARPPANSMLRSLRSEGLAMGGDLIPRAVEMAREVRRGEAQHSPSALHANSLGRADIYRHAMWEAAYVTPRSGRASAVCEVCGYDFSADSPRRSVGDGFPRALSDTDLTDAERKAIRWVIGKPDPEPVPASEVTGILRGHKLPDPEPRYTVEVELTRKEAEWLPRYFSDPGSVPVGELIETADSIAEKCRAALDAAGFPSPREEER